MISVYDDLKFRHVWRIGATPCALPPTDTNLPYLNSLGDTAIDFDIAPPRVVTEDINQVNVNETTTTSINVCLWQTLYIQAALKIVSI